MGIPGWSLPLVLFAASLLLVLAFATARLLRDSGVTARRSRTMLALLWAASWLLAVAVLAGIGSVAATGATGSAGAAGIVGLPRVSPSAGFWLMLAGAALAARWAKRTLRLGLLLRIAGTLAPLIALMLAWRLGLLDRFSPYLELRSQGLRFMQELWRHIVLSLSAFAFALVAGVAGAVLLSRGRRAGRLLGAVAGIIQNIPSLALFGLLLPAMAALATAFPVLRAAGISGIGFAPAFLALTAYALLPVMLSGAAGLRMVDAGARGAARGMGMSAAQILLKVELPLALPAIAAGARTALVQTIGTTTVAALIGAGGMGYFVFQGVGQAAMDMVIIGVVPIVGLSVAADALMAALGRTLATKGGAAWH